MVRSWWCGGMPSCSQPAKIAEDSSWTAQTDTLQTLQGQEHKNPQKKHTWCWMLFWWCSVEQETARSSIERWSWQWKLIGTIWVEISGSETLEACLGSYAIVIGVVQLWTMYTIELWIQLQCPNNCFVMSKVELLEQMVLVMNQLQRAVPCGETQGGKWHCGIALGRTSVSSVVIRLLCPLIHWHCHKDRKIAEPADFGSGTKLLNTKSNPSRRAELLCVHRNLSRSA